MMIMIPSSERRGNLRGQYHVIKLQQKVFVKRIDLVVAYRWTRKFQGETALNSLWLDLSILTNLHFVFYC